MSCGEYNNRESQGPRYYRFQVISESCQRTLRLVEALTETCYLQRLCLRAELAKSAIYVDPIVAYTLQTY